MSGQSVELANQPQATQDDLEQAGVFFAGLQRSNGAFRNISPAVLAAYIQQFLDLPPPPPPVLDFSKASNAINI